MRCFSVFLLGFGLSVGFAAEPKVSPREALQPFGLLVGTWRGTGTPEGTAAEKQKNFWTESSSWEWQFKGDDVWLKVTFDKSKHFTAGELRVAGPDRYKLTLTTPEKETLAFEGTFADKKLTLERTDPKTKLTQRLLWSLLHPNRILYRLDEKPTDAQAFVRKFQVGCTKEGEAFAAGGSGPECIVTGGAGTIRVTHQGQTYYVCCSGCKDEFNANPDKYVKDYEAKKKAKK